MAKCNQLTSLPFKGLISSSALHFFFSLHFLFLVFSNPCNYANDSLLFPFLTFSPNPCQCCGRSSELCQTTEPQEPEPPIIINPARHGVASLVKSTPPATAQRNNTKMIENLPITLYMIHTDNMLFDRLTHFTLRFSVHYELYSICLMALADDNAGFRICWYLATCICTHANNTETVSEEIIIYVFLSWKTQSSACTSNRLQHIKMREKCVRNI